VPLLLVFGVALLVAVLFSEWSNRTVLSSAVLFLAIGFIAGPRGATLLRIHIDAPIVMYVSDFALFAILFTDGLKVGIDELRSAWRLPGRALLVGLPATVVGIAITGHAVLGLSWTSAFLVGAILSPTDPVFAAAIVGREEIPERVRQLLNVESGLNDGLALPLVIALLAANSGSDWMPVRVFRDAASGLLLGIATAMIGGWLRRVRIFTVTRTYEPLHALSIGVIVIGAARTLNVNEYLAAFSAGMTLASISPRVREEFDALGEQLSEILKLAAVLIFAVTIGDTLAELPWRDLLFTAIVLALVRTIAIGLALVGSGLTGPERLVVAWFGPKGFASIIYGLMLLRSHSPDAIQLFQLIALVIIASVVIHSSTDVPVARYFRRAQRSAPA
jgi:sodium/hydrogen antiporter